MVVGFVSCVLSGVLRAVLSSSGPGCAKLVSNELWRAVWLGGLSGYGSKKGGSFEPPIVGRFWPGVGHLNATKGCAIIGQNSPPGGNNGKQNRHPWLTCLACGQLYKGKISGLYSCRPTCGY